MTDYDRTLSNNPPEFYDAGMTVKPTVDAKGNVTVIDSSKIQLPKGMLEALARYAKRVLAAQAADMELASKQAQYLAIINREAELTRAKAAADEEVSAWCADFTEDLTGTVATMEVSGEVNPLIGGGINIRPADGDRAAYNDSYGKLQRSALMSEAGFAWNFTMLQPWMKWKPFWRYATVTAKDEGANTVNVNLHPILSKAGAWLAKQADFNEPWGGSMSGVPVQYMSCGAAIFEPGDEVVIEFRQGGGGGLSYAEPFCIGFKQEPKECIFPEFAYLKISSTGNGETFNGNNGTFDGWTYPPPPEGYQNHPDFIGEIMTTFPRFTYNGGQLAPGQLLRVNNYWTNRVSPSEIRVGGPIGKGITNAKFYHQYDIDIGNNRIYYRQPAFSAIPSFPGEYNVRVIYAASDGSGLYRSNSVYVDEINEYLIDRWGVGPEIVYQGYTRQTTQEAIELGLGAFSSITPPPLTLKYWRNQNDKIYEAPAATRAYRAIGLVYMQSDGAIGTAVFGKPKTTLNMWIEYERIGSAE